MRTRVCGRCFLICQANRGYNKRVRDSGRGSSAWSIGVWLRDTLGDDDLWVVDSTPVECGRPRDHGQTLGPGRVGRVRRTAPRIRASSGDCDCIWCAPCRDCPVRALTGGQGRRTRHSDRDARSTTSTARVNTSTHQRRSSATRTITAANSRPRWPTHGINLTPP